MELALNVMHHVKAASELALINVPHATAICISTMDIVVVLTASHVLHHTIVVYATRLKPSCQIILVVLVIRLVEHVMDPSILNV
jgi:hypothetical protein